MAKSGKSRQEFDKDYIFNLIMPSDTGPARLARDEMPAGLTQEDLELEPAPQPQPDSLQRLKEALFAHPEGVAFAPAKELVLVNLMETLVVERLDAAFEKFNCCRCDKCKKDAATLALNSLPPYYVLCTPDSLREQLDQCPVKEVNNAVIKAILHVKSHPTH